VDAGLREGGLGISINAGYAPGYGRKEYYELAKLAARRNVPTFTHVRYLSVIEPLSSFEAIEELVALSAITGAHMHICHLNSTSVRDIAACAELVKNAIDRGLRVTTEAYPYGAASSTIGAEIFRGNWLERWGADDYSSLELNGQPLNQQEIERLQASEPGSVVVMHWARPDDNEEDQKILDQSVLFPGGAIASDAMPWTDASGNLINDDVWPLPEDAYAHPRSSACFTRFLKRWAHDRNAIGLSDALAKCALIPARIMEEAVPQMRTKGRLQVGMDADLVVFDLANLKDNATFMEPAALSSGYRHVIVNGTPIIEEGARMGDRHPGRPVRRVL
jgi:N-acyl-D-glutamate deacylase